MVLVARSKIFHLDSVFAQLSQSEKRLFELTRLLRGSLKRLEFLAIVDLRLKSPFHDFFSYLRNALNKQGFAFRSLCRDVRLVSKNFPFTFLLFFDNQFKILDGFSVASLKCLYILDDLVFDVFGRHARLENGFNEFFKLDVPSW
jgi:hypothetical protein